MQVEEGCPIDLEAQDFSAQRVIVRVATSEEGVIFFREFRVGELAPFRDGGNDGYEMGKGEKDEFKLIPKSHDNHTRFNFNLPGSEVLRNLLARVKAGEVQERFVDFSIVFPDAGIQVYAQDDTPWRKRANSLKGKLQ